MIMINATANGLGAYSAADVQVPRFAQMAGTGALTDSASTFLAESETQTESQVAESELGWYIRPQKS